MKKDSSTVYPWRRIRDVGVFSAALLLASACSDDGVSPVDFPSITGPSAALGVGGILDLDAESSTWSEAYAINGNGDVVGWRNISAHPDELYFHSDFLWTAAEGMRRINAISDWTRGNDINSSGQIAGAHAYAAWFWDPAAGSVETIRQSATETGSVCKAQAHGINEGGIVVGFQDNCRYSQGFVWDSKLKTFSLIPGGGAIALKINRDGEVIVNFNPGAGGYAMIYDAAAKRVTVPRLPSFGGVTEAHGINDAGQVAGWSRTPEGIQRAFLWDRGATPQMRDLGTLGGRSSAAYGINNHGQVVGWSETAGGAQHAFAWDAESGMQDLGTINGGVSIATDINDKGQVVGWSTTTGTMRHAVRWDLTLGVEFDIRPGSSENPVHRKAKGALPTAILGSSELDVRSIDVAAVEFGPGKAREVHGKGHPEDVDGDGDLDLVLHFDVQAARLPDGATEACVSGKAAGKPFRGCDAVKLTD